MKLIFIWISILLCFASLFQLVMQNSKEHIWKDVILLENSSNFDKEFLSLTKVSTMMIGEVDVNDILELRDPFANLLSITFVVISVILLHNFMIAIAIGDGNDLQKHSDDKLFSIKIDHCIHMLYLRERIQLFYEMVTKPYREIRKLFRRNTNPGIIRYIPRIRMPSNDSDVEARVEINIGPNAPENQHDMIRPLLEQPIHNNFVGNKQTKEIYLIHILFGEEINNIAVIYKKKNKTFTTNVDLGPQDDSLNNSLGSRLGQINFRKKENTLIMRNKNLGITPIQLKDESYYTKLRRWFIGVNWNSLSAD